MERPIRIALLIESSRAYGRGLLRGVADYVRSHGSWSVFQYERALDDAVPDWLHRWEGDGILARIESRKLANDLEESGIPVVDLCGLYSLDQFPVVETNDFAVARLACDHLLECGFRHFAYCGFFGADYSERRKVFVTSYLAESDIRVSVWDSPHLRAHNTTKMEAEGLSHESDLMNWLISLPKPTGLIACNDACARQVLSVCRDSSIDVPGDIAVIGVDNDELICDLADPPLSSVENDTRRIGYVAAQLLASMISGDETRKHHIMIDPIGVVTRQSTDITAIDDQEIMVAMRFIRDHAHEGIHVEDVVEELHVSRSTLDRRFVQAIGRTPKAEIIRILLIRVKQLLEDTDFKLSVIAAKTGFKYAEYLSTFFKEQTGKTPGEYRKAFSKRRKSGLAFWGKEQQRSPLHVVSAGREAR